jgi:hypothetical protein
VFRGWMELNGQELSNSSRLVSHLKRTAPVRDDDYVPPMPCVCDVSVPYDDTWPGLIDVLNNGPYTLDRAPWFNAARPESAEFAGVWVMDVQGLDSLPVQRDIAEAVGSGGVASWARDTSRLVTFSALVVACSNAGARYGLNWLSCILRQANVRGGVDMKFYKAHPSDTSAPPATQLRTTYGTVLTKSPTVVEVSGKGGSHRHRQASIFRVEWEMVCTNPYLYGESVTAAVGWDSVVEESIEWAHAPDCEDTGSCDLPTIYNAECAPPVIELEAAQIPVCGGCLPLCSIERRVWEMAGVLPSVCEETTVSMRVRNDGDAPLTVNFYWRPCGSADPCDKTGHMTVSGLPAGMTVVADSITGRPYIDNDGERQRQVGIITTESGAPWRPIMLDTLMCWELVAESAPGAEYTVIVELRERDS